MLDIFEPLITGMIVGSICGTCIGTCFIIRKYYIDLKRHNTDVANITKNILHTMDEETGYKIDYMTARPIV